MTASRVVVRVRLDVAACVGHGRCYAVAPEVYDADDQGHCVVRHADEVPDEHHDAARVGADNCPEAALELHHHDPSTA